MPEQYQNRWHSGAVLFGYLCGTVNVLGDIVSSDPELWDSDLGIACRNKDGKPIRYAGSGTEIEHDHK